MNEVLSFPGMTDDGTTVALTQVVRYIEALKDEQRIAWDEAMVAWDGDVYAAELLFTREDGSVSDYGAMPSMTALIDDTAGTPRAVLMSSPALDAEYLKTIIPSQREEGVRQGLAFALAPYANSQFANGLNDEQVRQRLANQFGMKPGSVLSRGNIYVADGGAPGTVIIQPHRPEKKMNDLVDFSEAVNKAFPCITLRPLERDAFFSRALRAIGYDEQADASAID